MNFFHRYRQIFFTDIGDIGKHQKQYRSKIVHRLQKINIGCRNLTDIGLTIPDVMAFTLYLFSTDA
jgi:hypothetical protein